jgi:hypothetical protein
MNTVPRMSFDKMGLDIRPSNIQKMLALKYQSFAKISRPEIIFGSNNTAKI